MHLYDGDDYPTPYCENDIVNFPDTHPMSHILSNLYDKGGQSAIYDYVNENHKDWNWHFCSECDCDSPVWVANGYYLCAVCWAELDIED